MNHSLPPLPYAKDALQPFLSEEAVEIHYEKHHRGYVTKLNAALEDQDQYQSMSLEELIRAVPVNGGLFNNAAQIWNHTFFWQCMAPADSRKAGPEGALKQAIEEQHGSTEKLLEGFVSAATAQFGSGWAWLVKTASGEIKIVTTGNAETPVTGDDTPLLVCDVWEHAYYVNYRNDRPGFLKEFTNYINWEFVEANFG